MSDLKTPVVQFGTSRFLQAHADLFLSEAEPPVAIIVVQSSNHPARARRLAALAAPEGHPVRIRWISEGRIIDVARRGTIVRRTLRPANDRDKLARVIALEAEFILSNTSDVGFAPQPVNTEARPSQRMSYPAWLDRLLARRHREGDAPLTGLPLEPRGPDRVSVNRARRRDRGTLCALGDRSPVEAELAAPSW